MRRSPSSLTEAAMSSEGWNASPVTLALQANALQLLECRVLSQHMTSNPVRMLGQTHRCGSSI